MLLMYLNIILYKVCVLCFWVFGIFSCIELIVVRMFLVVEVRGNRGVKVDF